MKFNFLGLVTAVLSRHSAVIEIDQHAIGCVAGSRWHGNVGKQGGYKDVHLRSVELVFDGGGWILRRQADGREENEQCAALCDPHCASIQFSAATCSTWSMTSTCIGCFCPFSNRSPSCLSTASKKVMPPQGSDAPPGCAGSAGRAPGPLPAVMFFGVQLIVKS
jgi:hypothetical protein